MRTVSSIFSHTDQKAKDILIAYVSRLVDLDSTAAQALNDAVVVRRLKRKQYIVQPGYVCTHRTYVVQGAMRAFLQGNDGVEYTIALSIDDWWITDYSSYHYQIPATLFVEAFEDSLVVQLPYEAEQELLAKHPIYERFFRIISQSSFANLQKRLLNNLSMDAESRYDAFVARYPKVANRFPQYIIASFLGMSTEFLSKIRKRKAEQ